MSTPNLEGYVLKPGFIYSWENKKVTLPIKFTIDLWNKIHPYLERAVSETHILKNTVQEFKTAPCTSLKDIGNTVEYLLLNKS